MMSASSSTAVPSSITELTASPPCPISIQIDREIQKRPEKEGKIREIDTLLQQKLFHQLTETIFTYISDPDFPPLDIAAFIYSIALPLKQKIKPLKTLEMLKGVVDKLDPADGIKYLSVFEPVFTGLPEPEILYLTLKANLSIRQADLLSAESLLFSDIQPRLDKMLGVDPKVYGGFYSACANYFKAVKNRREFFEATLLYLQYTSLETVPMSECRSLAFELGLAALTAEGMYEFGDFPEMAVLTSLKGDEERGWILDLTAAATEGSLEMFDAAWIKHKTKIAQHLGDYEEAIQEKMTLLALLELSFRQPKSNRRLTFSQIADHCRVPIKQVELLVMKAMSFELLKGTIDGLEDQVLLTWVKPRAIDIQRIDFMKTKVLGWAENVKALVQRLEDTTPELLVS